MKRLLAFVLCLILVFAPTTPIVSAETADTFEQPRLPYIGEDVLTVHPDGTITSVMPAILNSEQTVFDNSEIFVGGGDVAFSAPSGDYGYTTGQTHVKISMDRRYIYSQLSRNYQEVYRGIDAAVRGLQESVTFSNTLVPDASTLGDLYHYYIFDNPELIYLASNCTLINLGNSVRLEFCYAISPDEFSGLYGSSADIPLETLKPRILAKQSQFDQKLNAFLATIPKNAPDFIKEALIYAKLTTSAYYNLDALGEGVQHYPINDNWTAYGTLCNGYGVCESYSEAFQALCQAAGIECSGVIGDAGGGHKWNVVKIDGNWYQCDPTFDDPIGGAADVCYYHYFNLTDEQMVEARHDWSYFDYPMPTCTATKHGHDVFRALYEFSDDVLHNFANRCDTSCESCSYTRYVPDHEYKNDYTDDCIYCDHVRKRGWLYEEGSWYFYRLGTRVYNEWVADSKGPCYLGWDGALVTESFVYENREEICYVDASGHILRNAWREYNGDWFYIDNNSRRLKNRWFLWNGDWYFFDEYGWMATNCWKKDSTGWVFLKSDGRMAKNHWVFWRGGWYFLNADGYMVTNVWKRDSKGWVYLGADGKMKTNAWVRDSNGWCYVDYYGYCVTDKWQRDSTGGWCYLNKNGNMVVSNWVYKNGCWYYCNASGYRVTGRQVIGGKTYYFNEHGLWLY